MSDRIIPVNYTTRRISDEARQRMSEGGRRGKEKQLAKKYANLKKNHPEKYAEVMAKLEKIRQEKQVGKIQD